MVDDFGIGGVCKRVPGVKLLDIMLGPVHKFVVEDVYKRQGCAPARLP